MVSAKGRAKGFSGLGTALMVVLLAGCTSVPDRPQSGTVDVRMEQLSFEPMQVTITANSTVRWTNAVSSPHDVTAADGSWQNPEGPGGLGKGASFARTFTEPGSFDYYCTIHSSGPGSGMWGTITVEAPEP